MSGLFLEWEPFSEHQKSTPLKGMPSEAARRNIHRRSFTNKLDAQTRSPPKRNAEVRIQTLSLAGKPSAGRETHLPGTP